MGNCLTTVPMRNCLTKVPLGNFNLLPEEIILDILSRLPTESVFECKLVSKLWRDLLQHPSFPRLHCNHLDSAHDSDGKLSFIFYTEGSDEEPFHYTEYVEKLNRFSRIKMINFRPPFKESYILGSCNGLICFNTRLDNSFYLQPAYICNPITREYIVIPNIERKRFLSGFGYIPSTKEYKVVRIYNSKEDPDYGITQVYTLGSGIGWRNSRKMDYNVLSFRQLGAFANGAIHWVDSRGSIVAFDLIDEEFRLLSSSPPCSLPAFVELHVFGGFLCACHHSIGGFDTWVLRKNKNNHDVVWSKEFSSSFGEPINFTKSGWLLCYDYRDKHVYRYAPKASSSRMLVNFGKSVSIGVSHKNTLVSLKALGEDDTKLMDSGERASSSGGQKAVIVSQRDRRKREISGY